MTNDGIERGAAEEASGTPLTPTEVDASRRPPSRGPEETDRTPADEDQPAGEPAPDGKRA